MFLTGKGLFLNSQPGISWPARTKGPKGKDGVHIKQKLHGKKNQ